MSIIISDAERVRQNAANKKDLMLPQSKLNDVPPVGHGFGSWYWFPISKKKVKELIEKSKFYNSKASWQ